MRNFLHLVEDGELARRVTLDVRDQDGARRVGSVTFDSEGVAVRLSNSKFAIQRSRIVDIAIDAKSTTDFFVEVTTKGDQTYNEKMQQKHPIRWALRLISRSDAGRVDLGSVRSHNEAQRLAGLLRDLGFSVRINAAVPRPNVR